MSLNRKRLSRTLSMAIVGIGLGVGSGLAMQLAFPPAVQSQTCASDCPAKPLQFDLTRRMTIQVVNLTQRTIAVEKVEGTLPVQLAGQGTLEFQRGGLTDPNPSIVFWEMTETPLKAKLSQPKPNVLRVELSFAAKKPGDRALYLRNNGRVELL